MDGNIHQHPDFWIGFIGSAIVFYTVFSEDTKACRDRISYIIKKIWTKHFGKASSPVLELPQQ